MKIFRLVPDETSDYEIEAEHTWGLPGLSCDVCGATWSNTGTAYPAVDLSVLPNANRYTDPRPVNRVTFDELVAAVRPLVPTAWPLPPGADFGPLVGTLSGHPSELAWLDSWHVLILKELWDVLKDRLEITGVDARLQGDDSAPLVELQLEPWGSFASESFPDGRAVTCVGCGRCGIKMPKSIVIDGSSLKGAPRIFRLAEFTTLLLARAESVEIFEQLGLRGARYLELAVRA